MAFLFYICYMEILLHIIGVCPDSYSHVDLLNLFLNYNQINNLNLFNLKILKKQIWNIIQQMDK